MCLNVRVVDLVVTPLVTQPFVRNLARQLSAASSTSTQRKLAAKPPITITAVTLDGLADGNFPATDRRPSAHHFTGPRVHYQVPNAGHNLPQEAPVAFAVLDVADLRSQPR